MSRESVLRGVVLPFLLSVVPGWGHIWIRRQSRGLTLFTLCFGAANAAFIGAFVAPEVIPQRWVKLLTATAVAIGVFALADILRITLQRRSRVFEDRREATLRKAIRHWMERDVGQAQELLEKLVRSDPGDPAVLVWSATVQGDIGKTRRALRTYRQALRVDDGTWSEQIRSDMAQLKQSK